MDNETRNEINKMIEDGIRNLHRKASATSIVNWFGNDVLREDKALDWIGLDSKEPTSDLAVGYIIGFMMGWAYNFIIDAKYKQAIMALPLDKVKEYSGMAAKNKTKFLKSQGIDVTKAEIEEIRDLIKPKIEKIRTEVYRALSI